MRAKFIYEAFREDSDPIKDMSMGLEIVIENWIKENDSHWYIVFKKHPSSFIGILAHHNRLDYIENLINTGNKKYINTGDGFWGGGINGAWLGVIKNKNIKMAKLLVYAGANPNFENSTPLAILVSTLPIKKTSGYSNVFTNKDEEMMKYLISVGATIPNTILKDAVKLDNFKAIKILLEAGAKVRLSNIYIAERHNNKKIYNILRKYY